MDKTQNCDGTQRLSEIASALKMILRSIGEDPERERLLQTPERFARAVLHLTCGYDMSPKVAINGAKFNRDYHDVALAHNATTGCSNVVLVKNIEIASLCEHHFLPFTGKAHIGYIPRDEVLGISKLARIAEIYARRLQIQERLTQTGGGRYSERTGTAWCCRGDQVLTHVYVNAWHSAD